MPHNPDHKNSLSENQANTTYRNRLNGWVIARKVSEQERQIVARFRSRSDAEGYMQHIGKLVPDGVFELFFDCQKQEVIA